MFKPKSNFYHQVEHVSMHIVASKSNFHQNATYALLPGQRRYNISAWQCQAWTNLVITICALVQTSVYITA